MAGGQIHDVVGPSRSPASACAHRLAALQLDRVPLAVAEADGFNARIARQRPGQAGRGILAAGEQHQGAVFGLAGLRHRASVPLGVRHPIIRNMDLDFSEAEIQRYSRHILLREVGGTGQAKLKAARVLVVGAGGLGSPLMLYLAAAGVGTIGIVDDDRVELSNLQRQVAHTTDRIGMAKAASAARAATASIPRCASRRTQTRLTAANALDLIGRYDIVCDGTDNFATRFLVSDACVLAKRTLVSAAVLRFEGQLSVFKPHAGGPCYRCLYPEPPPEGLVPACSEAGVLGAVTGVMGTLQATEVLKEILGIGETLSGRLLVWDALDTRFRTIRLKPDPACPSCGPGRTIRDLSAHGVPAGPACAV